jgi:hypothetical protein
MNLVIKTFFYEVKMELTYENLMKLGMEYVKERPINFQSFSHYDFFEWLKIKEIAKELENKKVYHYESTNGFTCPKCLRHYTNSTICLYCLK